MEAQLLKTSFEDVAARHACVNTPISCRVFVVASERQWSMGDDPRWTTDRKAAANEVKCGLGRSPGGAWIGSDESTTSFTSLPRPSTTTILDNLRTDLQTTSIRVPTLFANMSAPRSVLRFFGQSPLLARNQFQAQVSRNVARRSQARMQSTASAAEGQSAFVRMWNSPVGPKTVHFWAPIMKVGCA